MKTVAFYTLGCKVNQYDSQAMLEIFEKNGYTRAHGGQSPDVCVVNTCTVTGAGDKKSLQMIRRFRREYPAAETVITGCLAQRMGEALLDTGARLVLGTQHRANVVELLEKAIAQRRSIIAVDEIKSAPYEPLFITSHEGHTRAVMKIQEGCDNRCSYCIIPSVRGGVRSRAPESILTEAEGLAGAGFCELVLTGIHLTSYGKDFSPNLSLASAINAAGAPAGVKRVRLGSLEPGVADDDFIEAILGNPKVCPQFHLALQSGSDDVLRLMRRRYNTDMFREAVNRLKRAFPEASFTTDVIVGFPGETESDFIKTMDFCREIGFLKIHVFPYSEREGTEAAGMPGSVVRREREERAKRLSALGAEMSANFRRGLSGKERHVLFEEEDGGFDVGYTPEYVRVWIRGGAPGEIARVRLLDIYREGMIGEIVEC